MVNVFLHLLPLQEYIFRLEPGKVDSGKGKCPYDPKLNSVSALISKYQLLFFLPTTCADVKDIKDLQFVFGLYC